MSSKRKLNDKYVEVFKSDSSNVTAKKNKWYDINQAVKLANKIGEDLANQKSTQTNEVYKFHHISLQTFREKVNHKIKSDIYLPGIGIPKVKDDENDTSAGKKRKLYNFAMIHAVVDPFENQNEPMYQKIIPHSKATDFFYDNNWKKSIDGPLKNIFAEINLDKSDSEYIIEEVKSLIEHDFVKMNNALYGQNKLLIEQNYDLHDKYIHYHRLYNQISDKLQLIDKMQYDINEEIKNQGNLFNQHLLLSMSAVTRKLKEITSKINEHSD